MKLKKVVNDYTERYLKICTSFESLFPLSRTLCGKMSQKIIEKLEIVIEKTFSYCRNLWLSTKMVKIHGIEDH